MTSQPVSMQPFCSLGPVPGTVGDSTYHFLLKTSDLDREAMKYHSVWWPKSPSFYDMDTKVALHTEDKYYASKTKSLNPQRGK